MFCFCLNALEQFSRLIFLNFNDYQFVHRGAPVYLFEPEDLNISDVVDGALAVLTVRQMLVMA